MDAEATRRNEASSSNGIGQTNSDKILRERHAELQYLDLVQEILANGEHRPDRYESALVQADVASLAICLPQDPGVENIEKITPIYV